MAMRRNGFERPHHPMQMSTWVLFAVLNALFYGLCIPPVKDDVALLASFIVVHFVLSVCTVVATVKTTMTNPIDSWVVNKELEQESNDYCHLCDQHVQEKSKHCRLCNKCVDTFDHHCKWLNNCIGKKNYRSYLATLVSTLLFVAFELGVTIWLIVAISKANEIAEYIVQFVFLCIFAALNVGMFAMLAHLLGFHCMLIHRGLTTYDYIVMDSREKRERAAKRRREKAANKADKTSGSKMTVVRPTESTTQRMGGGVRAKAQKHLGLCFGADDADSGQDVSHRSNNNVDRAAARDAGEESSRDPEAGEELSVQ